MHPVAQIILAAAALVTAIRFGGAAVLWARNYKRDLAEFTEMVEDHFEVLSDSFGNLADAVVETVEAATTPPTVH